MAGVSLSYDLSSIDRLRQRISALDDIQRRALLNVIGATAVSQTQRRIFSEKTGPDGKKWQQWAESTAANRHGNQSLLFQSSDLARSIDHQITTAAVDIGSNLAYAATHQFGDQRTIAVPAHQRTITQAFGKSIEPRSITVKAHNVARDIPARPFLGVSAANANQLASAVDNYLDRVVETTLRGIS